MWLCRVKCKLKHQAAAVGTRVAGLRRRKVRLQPPSRPVRATRHRLSCGSTGMCDSCVPTGNCSGSNCSFLEDKFCCLWGVFVCAHEVYVWVCVCVRERDEVLKFCNNCPGRVISV